MDEGILRPYLFSEFSENRHESYVESMCEDVLEGFIVLPFSSENTCGSEVLVILV